MRDKICEIDGIDEMAEEVKCSCHSLWVQAKCYFNLTGMNNDQCNELYSYLYNSECNPITRCVRCANVICANTVSDVWRCTFSDTSISVACERYKMYWAYYNIPLSQKQLECKYAIKLKFEIINICNPMAHRLLVLKLCWYCSCSTSHCGLRTNRNPLPLFDCNAGGTLGECSISIVVSCEDGTWTSGLDSDWCWSTSSENVGIARFVKWCDPGGSTSDVTAVLGFRCSLVLWYTFPPISTEYVLGSFIGSGLLMIVPGSQILFVVFLT